MIEITTPEARLVMGHPMLKNPKTDSKTGLPRVSADGSPMVSSFMALAIPKQPGQDWRATEWGRAIAAEAVAAWPRGEHAAPAFAWKITDGDSAVPNKKGKAPNACEGFPGHWIIKGETQLDIKCFHIGKYDPLQQIQDAAEIKTGDYCRVVIEVKGNNSTDSPGIYLNPKLFELRRAGVQIITESGMSAAEAFGGTAPAAAQAPAPAVVAPPPVAPAQDFLQGPKVYTINGAQYTHAQLVGFGWTPEQIASLG